MRFVRSALISSAVIGSVVVMAGCQSNPSTAAYVGDQTVSTKQLQHEVDKGYSNAAIKSSFSQTDYRRLVLQNQIAHSVITQAAGAAKVTVPSHGASDLRQFVLAQQQGGVDQLNSGLIQQDGVAPSQQPQFFQDAALEAALAYQRGLVSADEVGIIQVSSQATAKHVEQVLQSDDSTYAALAKRYVGQNTAPAPIAVSSLELVQNLGQSAAAAVRAKTSFVINAQAGGYQVVHIFATDLPLTNMSGTELGPLLNDGYSAVAATLLKKPGMKVRVNPRFGTWNGKQGKVDGVANPAVLTPKASKSPQTSQ